MKKANTIKEIYNIFDPQQYLNTTTKDYYINVYEDFTDDLSSRLELSDTQETIFVAGQSGNGKSSALQLFATKYPELSDLYDIKILNARDIFDRSNIDIADVLLMMAFTIIEDNEPFKKEFFELLENMKKQKLQEIETIKENTSIDLKSENGTMNSGFAINLGILKIGADFKDIFKVDNQDKTTIRELVTLEKKDFIQKVNEIIQKYTREILKNEKRLLLIIDDIEKIRDSDDIFTQEINTILQIECSKIITMPIHLKRGKTFAGYDAKEISFKLKTKDGVIIEENIDLLKEIIDARLDNTTIIDDKAKRELVLKSGGNLRQLIKLVKESALVSHKNKVLNISNYDVEQAIFTLKRDYSSATTEIKEFLNYIKEHKNPENYSDDNIEKLKIATNESLIFAYFNGEIWYDLNPIISDN
ncbi:MAG: hypothetical protein U9R37_02770 [Campylobacterota bacterium]|nr:hypothetical protein [Campylobacterota bacterium]